MQLRKLYNEVSKHLSTLQKSFEELVDFHNRMIDEKARFIAKDIPQLKRDLADKEAELKKLLNEEERLAVEVRKSKSLEELEMLNKMLNDKHRNLGECEASIEQIMLVEKKLDELKDSLALINSGLFSKNYETLVKLQLNKFNQYFSEVSQELYNEQYALKFDRAKTRLEQEVYKFSAFNTNMSSGKKQGEISCFDIAYTLFADDEQIPCYHFLLNDKKELMHDNQLVKIAELVERENSHVQFVASILKDKLPSELNQEKYFVLKLSQDDKLFRIKNSTR